MVTTNYVTVMDSHSGSWCCKFNKIDCSIEDPKFNICMCVKHQSKQTTATKLESYIVCVIAVLISLYCIQSRVDKLKKRACNSDISLYIYLAKFKCDCI